MSVRMTWKCSGCTRRIFNGRGFLGAELIDVRGDGPVQWVPWHDHCHPDDDIYSIDIEQIRTTEHAERWTDHLYEKNWYVRSDWAAVMAGQGYDVAPLIRELDAADDELEAELAAHRARESATP